MLNELHDVSARSPGAVGSTEDSGANIMSEISVTRACNPLAEKRVGILVKRNDISKGEFLRMAHSWYRYIIVGFFRGLNLDYWIFLLSS